VRWIGDPLIGVRKYRMAGPNFPLHFLAEGPRNRNQHCGQELQGPVPYSIAYSTVQRFPI